MNFRNLEVEKREGVAVLIISRQKALNALDAGTLKELGLFLENSVSDKETRAVILTGQGEKAFVAGADVAAMSKMNRKELREFIKLGHSICQAIEDLPIPVIAAVNGFALGGGLELALSADFIYASSNARFGFPELKLGLIPGFNGILRLSRVIGRNRVRELVLTSDMIDAETACRMGIVNKVFPDRKALIDGSIETINKIISRGPLAVSSAMSLINSIRKKEFVKNSKKELDSFTSLFETIDAKEGMKAFLGRREPGFKGQ